MKYSIFEQLADAGYDELELTRWTTNLKKGPRWMIRSTNPDQGGVGSGDTVNEAAEELLYLLAVREGDGK